MGLAALLSAVESVAPHLGGMLAPGQLALVSALATTGALFARILVQKDLDHGT
jgi:hypothetical protein